MAAELVPAGPFHAAVLAGMHNVCFRKPWDADAFSDLLACPGTAGMLAAVDGTPAGLALWRVAADEAEILTIAVLPPWRRTGLGGRLLAAAAAAARAEGAASLFLEVAAENAAGLALYRGRGFSEVGRRKAYYEDGGDALVLRRDLLGE